MTPATPRIDRLALPVAAALSAFSLALFKLLSLFVLSSNAVLALLLAGHPVGALLARRWYGRDARRAVRHWAVALAAGALALLGLRWLAPELQPPWVSGSFALGPVLWLTAVAALVYAPVFALAGAAELLLLRAAQDRGGSAGWLYARLLGGTVLGLGLGYLLLEQCGVVGVLLAALALAVSCAWPRARRLTVMVAAPALLLCGVAPGIDAAFVRAVAPGGRYTARGALDDGGTALLSRWTPRGYTQLIDVGGEVLGAYDNLVNWDVSPAPPRPDERGALERFVFEVAPPGARIALIGVGGGRQLHGAASAGRGQQLVGWEINGAVVDYFTRVAPWANGGAFVADRVRVVGGDGRRGIQDDPDPWDAIYLPEAGAVLGYYRTMMLDLSFLHTQEAYAGYVARLRPDGLLAAGFYRWANRDDYLTARLAAIWTELGLQVRSYENRDYQLLLASRPGAGERALDRADALAGTVGLQRRAPLPQLDLARGPTPTDDLGLSIWNSFSPTPSLHSVFWGALAAVLAIAGAAAAALARRSGPGSAPGLLLAVALGAELIWVENAVILLLARASWDLADAVVSGAAATLAVAAAGAAAAPWLRRRRRVALPLLLGLAGAAAWWAGGNAGVALPCMLALAAIAGSFFPLLLERDPERVAALYAADGAGALLGAVVVFFVPMLWGIGAFTVLAATSCAVAGVAVLALPVRTAP